MINRIEASFLAFLRKIKLGKLADLYEKHQEGMRYIIFGFGTTFVNIVVAIFTYYIVFMALPGEIRVNVSTICAIIASWIFAYITNKIYVFDSKTYGTKELIQEIMSFVACRLLSAVIEVVLMDILVTRLGLHYVIMKVLVNIIVIVLNFIFSKVFIFKNQEKGEKENG